MRWFAEMQKRRFSVEPIVTCLKHAKLGLPVSDLIRQIGISEQTFDKRNKTVFRHRI